jgi:hypothetical protein
MNRIKEHIQLSNNIGRCKECKTLMLRLYLGNKLCKECDKKYMKMLNNIMQK